MNYVISLFEISSVIMVFRAKNQPLNIFWISGHYTTGYPSIIIMCFAQCNCLRNLSIWPRRFWKNLKKNIRNDLIWPSPVTWLIFNENLQIGPREKCLEGTLVLRSYNRVSIMWERHYVKSDLVNMLQKWFQHFLWGYQDYSCICYYSGKFLQRTCICNVHLPEIVFHAGTTKIGCEYI